MFYKHPTVKFGGIQTLAGALLPFCISTFMH